jgi:hypothetical protein
MCVHFDKSCNTFIGQMVVETAPGLEVIVKPQVRIIRAAAVNVGARDDKPAEFGAGIAVIAVKNIGADFHFQVLGHIPDRTGLYNSGRVLDIVDAGEK